jgi:hypothetical protein
MMWQSRTRRYFYRASYGSAIVRPTSAWIEIASTVKFDQGSQQFLLVDRALPLTDLIWITGRINIKRSVDVLLKRRVHV